MAMTPTVALTLVAIVALTLGCIQPIATPAELDVAHAIVLSSPFSTLHIQVDFVESQPPSRQSLEDLATVLQQETLKSTVTLDEPRAIPPTQLPHTSKVWNLSEVEDLHRATFRLDKDPSALGHASEAFLHILFLDSYLRYDYLGKTSDASGVTIRNVIVVFPGNDATNGTAHQVGADRVLADRPTAGGAILLHELGHAMGLVNLGAPQVRPHSLENDPHHSKNPGSVMYAGTEMLGTTQRTIENDLRRGRDLYDADDLADLAALRAEQR